MRLVLNIADDVSLNDVLYLLDKFIDENKEIFKEVSLNSI